VNAKAPDAADQIIKVTGGGAHGALVTAGGVPAFAEALNLVRRMGTIALNGLPPGAFPTRSSTW
jgi:alcohol dehydrogenase, propanol-preferring